MKHFLYILTSVILIVSLFFLPLAGKEKDPEFILIIDPGHGGKDFGAIDNNVKEKDINLAVAKELARQLKQECKDIKVVMTRDNDTYLTLQERADVANKEKGNLFISIHTNSVDKSNPNRKTVSGANVYALGLHKDQNNLKVAMRENSVIELEKNFEQKYSGFDPQKDESYIIFEMAQKKNLGQSLKFANEAQKQLVSIAGRRDRGVKQAGFWVLWATSMPAVLVELDFICNPNSAKYMASEKGTQKLAEALKNAVKDYSDSFKKGNRKVDLGSVAPFVEETMIGEGAVVPETAEDLSEARPGTLTRVTAGASIRAPRTDTAPMKNGNVTSRSRKRRSAAARKESCARDLTASNLNLRAESTGAEVIDEEKPKPEVKPVETQVEPKGKKKKSKQPKENKKKEKKDTKVIRTYNNKSIEVTVADGGNETKKDSKAETSRPKTHKADSGYHARVSKLRTVYKIQVLASADELKPSNPRFCGLKHISVFKENDMYKYTVGESENKAEMEKMLTDVRKKIPDAFIISSRK